LWQVQACWDNFLYRQGSCGERGAGNTVDSNHELVHRGVPTQSFSSCQVYLSTLKRRYVVFPPRQRSCPPLQSLHWVFAKYWAEGAGASSLQSRPRSMRLRAVPLREDRAKKETVFQRRGPSKGMGWRVCPDPRGNVEQLVRRLVSKDAKVHRVWWKLFSKIVKIKGVLQNFPSTLQRQTIYHAHMRYKMLFGPYYFVNIRIMSA
jgi:hypothetical protein